MVIPTSIKLDVDTVENFNIAVSNDGTEQDTLSLIGIDQEGVTFDNPGPVTIDRGESQYVSIGVTINSSIVGDITLEFSLSSTNSGQNSVTETGIFEVKPFAELSVSGPQDSRISIVPGSNSSITLNLSNDGTRDLDITPEIFGLPSGVTVVSGLDSLPLSSGASTDVVLILNAESYTTKMTTMLSIEFSSTWVQADIEIELQIDNRMDVKIDSTKNKLYASPVLSLVHISEPTRPY